MTIRVLVKYTEIGNEEYSVVEPFEIKYKSNKILRLDYCYKLKILKSLQERNIFCSHIEDLSVEFIYD